MNVWKRVLWVNVGLVVGFVASMFIVPPETPLWWVIAPLIALGAILNLVALIGRREKSQMASSQSGFRSNLVIGLGFFLFLADILLTRACRNR